MLAAGMTLSLAACTASGAGGFVQPMDDTDDRPMLLTFGLYVTPDPAQNPIDPPERFTGYHSALDIEIFEDEEDKDVPVYAVCDGTVTYAGFAGGYGGLVKQTCRLDGEDIMVLYGHLAISGMVNEGVTVSAGDVIGRLGASRSPDTDGSRKHLHLGMHRGAGDFSLGYVQSEEELKSFIDPTDVLPL